MLLQDTKYRVAHNAKLILMTETIHCSNYSYKEKRRQRVYLQNYDRGACENINFNLITLLETCYSKSILEETMGSLSIKE